MLASNLEEVLRQLFRRSDMSTATQSDIPVRFEALRGSGRLPRGRNNRERPLSDIEIASATFGLTPVNPKWAGFAAVLLSDLRPVGGVSASFAGSKTLGEAISRILSDADARTSLLSTTLSVAEYATNSNGLAVITFGPLGSRQRAAFVSKMAVSLLQPGRERDFDIDRFLSTTGRSVTLDSSFFERLATDIANHRAFPRKATGDGAEYDEEEAKQARYAALGVRRGSIYLNMGVDAHVNWPRKEALIQFDKYQLVLMPPTKDNSRSVHVDLTANGIDGDEAITVINRFLSMLSWCDDQSAVLREGWSGNPVPVPVGHHSAGFSTTDLWLFNRQIPSSDEGRRAVALFREALNAEEASLISFTILSYYKILEIKNWDPKKIKRWITNNYSEIRGHVGDRQLSQFDADRASQSVEDYIYDSCRLAVAHASIKKPSDPDDRHEIQRLYAASYILRQLARRFIVHELDVSADEYVPEEGIDEHS